MRPRDRILDAAMQVFRRHGFQRSSIEQTAEAAGLTRQALYHHFESKQALFRAVIEHVHEGAVTAEIAAVSAAESQGSGLADILIAGISARMKQFIASFDGSPHVEEIFSEHLLQARDLYQKYAAHYAAQLAVIIERVCRRQKIALAPGMNAAELARCIEMAMHGAKTANPGMQPPEAFLRDLDIMVRMLVAGAVAPRAMARPAKSIVKKSVAKQRKSASRKPPSKTPGGRR